jgi:hypothetical protein
MTVETKRAKSPVAAARAPKAATPRVEVEAEAPAVAGSEASLEKHRAAAEAIADGEVIPLRADAHLAYHNAVAGRDAVLAAKAPIEATGFRVEWELVRAIGEVAEAVIFADGRVDADPEVKGEVLVMLREARPLRALMLSEARTRALKHKALLPEVRRIEKGRGAVDAVQDLIDLATFFTRNKLARAGGAVTPADLKRAAELGAELLRRLKPKGAKRGSARSAEQQKAAALRDRLWTLLVRRYEHLECAGGAAWGRLLDEHIPSLQSRYVAAKRTPKTPKTP